MADASGPVETLSGKTEVLSEFIPQEYQSQSQVVRNNEENNRNDFKLPEPNSSRSELKKPESSQAPNGNESITVSSEDKRCTPVLSPAEQLKQSQVSIPYKEPIWGGLPPESEKYSFDVLKNGTVVENVELGTKPWLVFGRLPSCDVYMEHPSLSRHHAVVQYREVEEDGKDRGWYLYDLDSTHGTWVNKEKIHPKVYRRLRVGHVVKFGGSSRLYILQGPQEDQEPESELSVTELKQQTARLKRETELLKQAEMEEKEEMERQRQKILELRGCSWGMGEDATEEDEAAPSSLAGLTPEHEHLYKDDPKKALKGFYEREGCDLPDYQFTEVGYGKHKCVVELPVDGPNGEVLVAEATVSGKKKDAVVACALEACRLLDMHGMLHASKHESRKKKGKNWADDDFYDSDEDTFLDRTGTIEKKRIYRMKKCGQEEHAETYETLVPKHEEVQKHIAEIERKLEQAKAEAEANVAGEEEDALEAYMRGIREGGMDTSTRLALKRQLLELRTQEQRLRRLVRLARPANLPVLLPQDSGGKKTVGVTSGTRKIGTVRGPSRPCPLPQAGPIQSMEEGFQEEEEEEGCTKDSKMRATSSSAVTGHSKNISSVSETGRPSLGPETGQIPASEAVQKSRSQQTVGNAQSAGGREPSTAALKKPATFRTAGSETVVSEGGRRGDDNCSVRGPTLPPTVQSSELTAGKPAAKSYPAEQRQTSIEPPKKKKKKQVATSQVKGDYDDSDPNYAIWMPPQNQSGDGRTSLNDKLGY